MNTNLSFNTIKSPEDFHNLQRVWTSLIKQAEAPSIYQTWEWLTTWWDVYGYQRNLCLVTAYDDEQLVGIAPFSIPTQKTRRFQVLPYRTLWYLCSGQTKERNVASEYTDFIVQKGREQEFIVALLDWLSRQHFWDEIIIPDVSLEKITIQLLPQAARRAHLNFDLTSKAQSILIRLPTTWEQYLKSLNRNLRYKINRGRKELEKAKGQYHLITSQKEIPKAFAELERLHQARWQGKGESGAFACSHWKSFHRQIIPIFQKNNWLKLSFLELNGENVAANYNFVFDKKVHYFQSGLIPQQNKHLRLGLILHSYCIEEAINEGMEEYDFLKYWPDGSNFKTMWQNDSRDLATVRISRKTHKENIYSSFLRMHQLLRQAKHRFYPLFTSHEPE
jgi:CelD/BcsL family acetyltransferase involved in cellulose biosynthesis